MQFSISNVCGNTVATKTNDKLNDYKARQNGVIVVKKGMTLSSLAKKFNMSVDDFKKFANLKSSELKIGQQIKVPTAKIENGKGINFLAKQHGMTIEQFCQLNGIPKNYSPKKDEVFYIYPKKTGSNKRVTNSKKTASAQKQTNTKTNKASNTITTKTTVKKPTPEQIADSLEKFANDNIGGIGNKEFNEIFSQINKENVIPVMKAFEKKYNKSLINMISDEWWSSKDARKDVMTKVYDMVAVAKGSNDKNNRNAFINELNKQFNSFGTVSTEKLDKMINDLANKKPNVTSKTKVTPNTKITLSNGKTYTLEALQKDAISSAKRSKEYKNADARAISRPLPNYNPETGKIEARTEMQLPTSQTGSLKGKVVILNPGHGGYQQGCGYNDIKRNKKVGDGAGYFDSGTVYSVKNADGTTRPIEEWKVAQSYVNIIATKLRAQGATVVIVQGAIQNGGMSEQKFLENMLAGKKGSPELRKLMTNTDKSNMMFLSVHVDGAPGTPESKKCSVKYTKPEDKLLSYNIAKHVKSGISVLAPTSEKQELYVNNATKGIRSSLIEVGNIANPTILNTLLSSSDQDKYANCVVNAIIETFNTKKR